ncbi:hypothetical protein L6R52_40625 [Myxococcota bacterium]|nr:hypothetical protein [Myxococcota bacterium]
MSVALFTLALTSACASSTSTAPSSANAAERAEPAAAVLVADPTTPEPEVVPCKNCGVDVLRRVTGTFVDAKCGAGVVVFPIASVTIDVLDGEQAGQRFLVTTSVAKLVAGTSFDGEAAAGAKPDGWVKVQVVATDAAGKTCPSPMSIYR